MTELLNPKNQKNRSNFQTCFNFAILFSVVPESWDLFVVSQVQSGVENSIRARNRERAL